MNEYTVKALRARREWESLLPMRFWEHRSALYWANRIAGETGKRTRVRGVEGWAHQFSAGKCGLGLVRKWKVTWA